MSMRGIRGATTVEADQPDLILAATQELLDAIMRFNALTTSSTSSSFKIG